MNDKILCFGNISFDLIQDHGKRKVAPDALKFTAKLGGSVCNTAVLTAKLGMDVCFLSKTGRDFLSDGLLSLLAGEKVSTRSIIRSSDIKPSLAFAHIDARGNSSYIFYKEDARGLSFSKKELSSLDMSGLSVLHTGSSFAFDDNTYGSVLYLLDRASQKGVFCSLDPNWRTTRIKDPKKARQRILSLLKYVDLLKLSDEDLFAITGSRSIDTAVASLANKTKGTIIVTLGEKGSVCRSGREKIRVPAFKIPIKDTIGAGDAFTAGLLYRVTRLGPDIFLSKMRENLVFASAVSALVCQKAGATDGLRNISQIKSFLKQMS